MALALGDWFYVPGVFGAFEATIFWWIATGLDILVTLLLGCALGLLFVKLTAPITPAVAQEDERVS